MTTLHIIAPLAANSDWHHGGHWWFPFTLLWLIVLGAAIWFVARQARPRERSGIDRASDILAERFARSELTAEEYRERLEQLR
ncbi:MAG: putative rane protein [Gaiellales bacterium]|jgi:putative membrane protein|nr:putative rane protein [Gaiellales bacterium]